MTKFRNLRKSKNYQESMADIFDDDMALDVPYNQLNAKGRKAKRKRMLKLGR